MPKTDKNLQATEQFIRSVLAQNFKQEVGAEALRDAATKLCAALPGAGKKAA
jgi:hypothetical protein